MNHSALYIKKPKSSNRAANLRAFNFNSRAGFGRIAFYASMRYNFSEVNAMTHEHINPPRHEALDHEYMHAHGIPHAHDHGHTHSHEHTKAVLNRLSRAIGHLQSVKSMVEEGRDCSEVLVQIAAVRAAIDKTGKLILQDHLKHCIVDAAMEGDQQAIDDLCEAIDKYMK